MKETPIIFSTPMVQAILAGRKTQTRRPIKLKHFNGADIGSIHPDGSGKGWIAWSPNPVSAEETIRCYPGEDGFKCPFGIAGDLIYVREEHYRYGDWDEIEGMFTKTGKQKWGFIPHTDEVKYDKPDKVNHWSKSKPQGPGWYKRLARFMPKSAARIWLEIESVRAEKLTDISEEDAKAEGFACKSKDNGRTWKYGIPDKDGLPGTDDIGWPWHEWSVKPISAFRVLWERINGLDSWQPVWVWVITFRVLSKTGRPDTATLPSDADAWKREND